MSLAFSISNFVVLPFWALMILAPRARLTTRVMSSPWVVVPPIFLYAWAILPALPQVLPVVAQPELDSVAALLGAPLGALAGWAHFLAFDMFVARFIVLDARERELPWYVLSPILLTTLLLGPLGLLSYLIVRAIAGHVKRGWRLSLESSRQLSVLGLLSLLTAAACLVLMQLDPRQLMGAPLWLKPLKFGVSIAIAAFTVAFLLPAISVPERARKRLETAIAWLTGLELAIITGQAARGVPSHFNAATLLDSALFFVMGVAIAIVTLAFARLAVYAWRTQFSDAALGSGVRAGLLLVVFGSSIAFLMPRPTPDQLASMRDGAPVTMIGSHTVGAADDSGRGMPLTRWSSAGGDLRVPHFIGLHALQLLPLAGLALSRRFRQRPALAVNLTRHLGFAYFGLTLTSLVQALRGQPVLAPDALTWAMLASVVLLTATSAVATSSSKLVACAAEPSRS
jgi:uncharacterized membrane protein (DUF485 family)